MYFQNLVLFINGAGEQRNLPSPLKNPIVPRSWITVTNRHNGTASAVNKALASSCFSLCSGYFKMLFLEVSFSHLSGRERERERELLCYCSLPEVSLPTRAGLDSGVLLWSQEQSHKNSIPELFLPVFQDTHCQKPKIGSRACTWTQVLWEGVPQVSLPQLSQTLNCIL